MAKPIQSKRAVQRLEGAQRLKFQLERNAIARNAADPRNSDPRLKLLQRWQAERLARDYESLRQQPKNDAACDFFLMELYGDQDFSQRDKDVERIYPIMVKLLPAQVLETVSRAVELNALSHELDLAMLAHLPADLTRMPSFAQYAAAYQQTAGNGARRYQLARILFLGRELARVVKIPLMYKLLQMCRWPAKMAGLGALQAFLERGFAAFVKLDGARPFLNAIRMREKAFMQMCVEFVDS
jgi:hypothetical protein